MMIMTNKESFEKSCAENAQFDEYVTEIARLKFNNNMLKIKNEHLLNIKIELEAEIEVLKSNVK